MKKKIVSMLLASFLVVGCSGVVENESDNLPVNDIIDLAEPVEYERTTVNIATLKGPTGLGMVQLMDNDEKDVSLNDYEFQILGNPADVVGKVVSGEIDIAAVPTNMASILYNKTERGVTFLGVNTLGVLYILENGDTITTISDLEGKTLYATGLGAVPEYVIKYILSQNNLLEDKVTVEFKAEHSELSTLMANGDITLGMLPQPNVTATLMKNEDVRIAIDISKEWEKLNGTPLTMGGIIVRNEFLEENKEAVDNFIAEYASSVEFTNVETGEASVLAEKFEIFPSAVIAEAAIPYCNIVWNRDVNLTNFFNVLMEENPASIGGEIPVEDFYYSN